MSYQTSNIISIAIAATLAGIGVILAGTPESFGLSPVIARWLGVVVAVLGVIQTKMPHVTADRLTGKED